MENSLFERILSPIKTNRCFLITFTWHANCTSSCKGKVLNMLIVDHQATAKLVQRLDVMHAELALWRCLCIPFSAVDPALRPSAEELGRLLRGLLPERMAKAQMYVLEDGDVYVLAEILLMREVRQLGALLPMIPYGAMQLYDLQFEVRRILIQLEGKLEATRQQAEAARQAQEADAQQRHP
jgi:hypothetical protein